MAITQDFRNTGGLTGPSQTLGASTSQAMGLGALAMLLWQQMWTILAVVAAFLAAAAVYLLLATRTYTASIQIILDPRDQRVLPSEIAPAGTGSDTALVESQLSVITSDAILGQVIDALKLTNDSEWVSEANLTAYQNSKGVAADHAGAAKAVALDAMRKAVTVRRAERTYVIEIRSASRDAGMARRLADKIAETYIASQTETIRARSRVANEALTARLESLRGELRQAENKLQDFRTANGLVGAQGNLVSEQQLQEISLRLTQAQVHAAETKSRADRYLALARAGAIQGTTEAFASTSMTEIKKQLTDARRREAELYPALGDNHPTLIEARRQVAVLSQQLAAEANRIAHAAEAEADVAAAEESALRAQLAELKGRAQSIDSSLIGQRDLERDVQSARQIYEAFLNRAKETREREGIDKSNASLIAPAALLSPNPFPGNFLVIALALAGGLGLGMALALFRVHMKNGVTGPAQLRALTGVEALNAGVQVQTLNPFRGDIAAFRQMNTFSDLGVTSRALRNELRDTPLRRGERALLCAAPQNPIDAAAVALRLAESVAVGGERVLLIDADAVQGALSKALELDDKIGLADALSGKSVLTDAVTKHEDRAIWILPRGKHRGQRSTSDSAALPQMVAACAAQFDYVIISPGALLVDPDALTLAAAADQIVMVAREYDTSVDAVQKAMRLLGRNRDKLRRTVLLSDGTSARN